MNRKGLGLKAVNLAFRHLLRQNVTAPCPVHFTSQVIEGEYIYINGDPDIKKAFAQSGHCYYQAKNHIYIQPGTRWGPGVKMISANRVDYPSDEYEIHRPIRIGTDCLIGSNAIILPGVWLADNTIVGAGSVVTKSVGNDCLTIAGNPARIIGQR